MEDNITLSPTEIKDTTKAFRRGVKLLDKKVPNWRKVLDKHKDQFEFSMGDHCVLGTLEHHVGKLRVAAKKHATMYDTGYNRLMDLWDLGLGNTFGFDGPRTHYPLLDALWRAEFEKD